MPDTYDVAVLGAGPGGYVAAIRCAQLGLKTAIVEKEKRLGGTCLLRGCIPTKALLHTAELLDRVSRAADFGVEAKATLDFAKAQRHKERVVAKMTGGIDFLMRKNKVDVVKGHGRIAGKGTLEVRGESGTSQVSYRSLILATGSVVKDLPSAMPDHRRVVTSDSILELKAVPRSLAVLGAGPVGVEFASAFASFGAKVTVIEMLPHLLPLEDEEVSKEFEKAFRRRGIGFHIGAKLEKVETGADGVKLTVVNDGNAEVLEAEMLLSAVGRRPVTEDLGLENTAVKLDRGFIRVDANMRTDEPGVFAIGDIVPTPMLAHVASHEGIVAAETIAGHATSPVVYDQIPSCSYASPEVASVGLSEKKAKERGYEVRTGSFPFAAVGKAAVSRESEGFVKIVADGKAGRVLGVHIVGPKATELVAEACVALRLGATTEDFARTVHAHPTLAEAMGEAAHAALGAAISV